MTDAASAREQPQPRIVVDLSTSLDGFIAGPNDGLGNPVGDGVRPFEGVGGGHVELKRAGVIASTDVTHLRYDVVNRRGATEHENYGKIIQ
ncbi:hypothetical protein [Haladaptatus halobius]|uniref:hypothetical protein n=1 Tax=Haladaptatus halobius TaxID=2884875 RepID=UPI001D0ADF32|nr:hypothetical protein [Haladaptatus halobius]